MGVSFDPGRTGPAQRGGKVNNSTPIEESQIRQFAIDTVNQNTPAAPVVPAAPADKAQKPTSTLPENRHSPLNDRDLSELALQVRKAPTSQIKQVLATMIQHGVAVTPEAVDVIDTLARGAKKGNAIDSAVIAYSKEVPSSRAVSVLASFFGDQSQFAGKLEKLTTQMMQFRALSASLSRVLDSGLNTGLQAVLSEMTEQLAGFQKKNRDGVSDALKLSHPELFKDLKTLFEFLGGVDKKAEKSPGNLSDVARMRQRISDLKESISEALDGLVTQAILSRSSEGKRSDADSYLFWQVPNPLTTKASTVDILVKKDTKDPKSVDMQKTRVILRFETPELGEVTIIMDLRDNKIWYVFQTASGETKRYVAELSADLNDRMKSLNYEVVGLQTVIKQKKLDLREFLLPVFDLDKIHRIVTEA